MYSYSDIKKIYSLGKIENSLKNNYPELSDISEILNIILFRTAFFSDHIDDKTSYITINYIIDLLLSIPKDELKLIDHHLIDTFTYPYKLQHENVINGLNSIFRSNEVEDINTYLYNFTRIFGRLNSVHAAGINICKYKKLDILVNSFSSYMVNLPTKRDYYAFLQLIVAYIYRNINDFDEEKIYYIFNSLFNDEYYLSKIKLNTNLPLDELIESSYQRGLDESIIYTYDLAIDTVNKILNNGDLYKEKRIIK